MSRRFTSPINIPTWESLKDTPEQSGEDESEEEVDQIRATPAPTTVIGSHLNRSSYKRKESDWKLESLPKRARHEKSPFVNLSATIQGPSGSKPVTHTTHAQPSTSALPLPSRFKKGDLQLLATNNNNNQPPSTSEPTSPLTSQGFHKAAKPPKGPITASTAQTKPSQSTLAHERRSSLGNNIPSTIDSTLFSAILSKRANLSSEAKAKSTDVIEISDDDGPPSPVKGKEKVTNSPPSSNTSYMNRARKSVTSTPIKPTPEVIEIFDSDEERAMQTPKGRLSAGKSPEFATRSPPASPTGRISRKDGPSSLLTSRLPNKNDNLLVRLASKTKAISRKSGPGNEVTRPIGNSRMLIDEAPQLVTPPSTAMGVAAQEQMPRIPKSSSDTSPNSARLQGHGFNTLTAPPMTTPPSSPGRPQPVGVISTMPSEAKARTVGKPPSHSRANSDVASAQPSMKGKAKESAHPQIAVEKQQRDPWTKSNPITHRPFQELGNSLASAIDLTSDVSDREGAVQDMQPSPEKDASSPQISSLGTPPSPERSKNNPVSDKAAALHSRLEIEKPSRDKSLHRSDTPEGEESSERKAASLEGSDPPPSSSLESAPSDQKIASTSNAVIVELPTIRGTNARRSSASSQEIEDVLARYVPESDDEAMQDADEFDAMAEDLNSMDSDKYGNGGGMWVDSDADHPSESLIPSQKISRMTLRTSPDSGDASSEPPPSRGSPVSVPSTHRSSRLSSYSNSEDARLPFDEDRSAFPSVPTSRSTTPDHVATVAIRSRTLGGFPAFCFETYRTDPRNFPKVYYASELPSAIQDHMNSQSEEVRRLGDLREVYEGMILENTADDERDAPPITIQNDVDDEPTPPWEFWYSNKMWHGEGVPDPDLKNLKGCDCRGVCNPKSKTCACAIRHRQYLGEKAADFAYDKNGKLKYPGYPIFECNNKCWCGPECINRVVQCGRKVQVSIQKTINKGWGVFNGPKKITQGTFIGIYAGELLTDTEAHDRGLKYNKAGITYLFDLDFHHLRGGNDDDEWSPLYTVDAYHTGNFTRFLNHSCNPNCRLYPCYINEGNIEKPLLVVFSIRDIEPHEEICFNYQGRYPGDEDDEETQAQETDKDIPKDKIYKKCECGFANCRGVMFN